MLIKYVTQWREADALQLHDELIKACPLKAEYPLLIVMNCFIRIRPGNITLDLYQSYDDVHTFIWLCVYACVLLREYSRSKSIKLFYCLRRNDVKQHKENFNFQIRKNTFFLA